jgi:hypothetical protein
MVFFWLVDNKNELKVGNSSDPNDAAGTNKQTLNHEKTYKLIPPSSNHAL